MTIQKNDPSERQSSRSTWAGTGKVSVVEVKARAAGVATRGVGSRAITGGYTTTINPDLVCMRTGNTERHPGTACECVPFRPLERELCMGNGALGGG